MILETVNRTLRVSCDDAQLESRDSTPRGARVRVASRTLHEDAATLYSLFLFVFFIFFVSLYPLLSFLPCSGTDHILSLATAFNGYSLLPRKYV